MVEKIIQVPIEDLKPAEYNPRKDWTGERVFCNPPYGTEIKHWVTRYFH